MQNKILSKQMGLDHNVKRVLEIAEEIMRENKGLNTETLYNVAKKSLNLLRNGLLFIIQFLINKKILIEGSKFSRDTVLLNPIKRGIYNFIRMNPGAHFSIIRKKYQAIKSELIKSSLGFSSEFFTLYDDLIDETKRISEEEIQYLIGDKELNKSN